MSPIRDLLALTAFTALFLSPASTQTIRGTVLDDSTSQPIIAAEVFALDTSGTIITQAVTDSSGRFRLGVTPGTYSFRVLRIGYTPTVTTVLRADESGGDIAVVIRVPSATSIRADDPYALTPIVVEAPPVQRFLATFHRHESIGMGDHLQREEFERWNPQQLTDVVRRMRGFTIAPNPYYMRELPDGRLDTREYLIDVPGRPHHRTSALAECAPLIFLDGAFLGNSQRVDINSLPLHAVAAVEAYGTLVETPVAYQRAGNECGTIALWSRAGEPGQSASPFELGVRYGGTFAGDPFVGGRIGIHLITPFTGPFEFYPAFYMVANAFSDHQTPENSSWMAQIALRTSPRSMQVPVYAGSGLILVKPDVSYRTVMDGVDMDPRYTVFSGVKVDVGFARPFVELHVLDFFSSSSMSAQVFLGMGVQF